MKRISPSAILAGVSLAVLAGVGAWGWSLEPERALRWAILALFFPGLWLMAELGQVRGADRRIGDAIMRFNRCAISFGAWLLALKIGLKLSIASSLVDPAWGPIGDHVGGLTFGAGMILAGNHLPKLASPWRVAEEPFDWQRVHHRIGWLWMLSGVVVLVAWSAASVHLARQVTFLVTATAAVGSVGTKWVSLAARSGRVR